MSDHQRRTGEYLARAYGNIGHRTELRGPRWRRIDERPTCATAPLRL
jgi:hypothetical protein